ncbi:NAD(P)/FAD-dependent oxidoreductase [Microlunatus sp. Gsoil 973]|uniref:flavin-containing monooxygenase n=1 Tax=Microlunatus sp. Gsoil 973 TaxID=2672569 RepID=UPI0012B4AE86|nr:NAD(P)/FAD-dependent oxidoreductase [Microlunatus sp. Gsoil 973]QGN33010.1 NAD(P)-binding protein [Microlunatus sp. Gsoil 973]
MPATADEHVDVLIIGAGISGIGAAYRLQQECPDHGYAIVEARDRIGGTWDLFRYPGIRSDSDIFTFSYPFKPWPGTQSLAEGADIRNYLEEIAAECGIDRRIRFGHRVTTADWSSTDRQWTVTTVSAAGTQTWTCKFLYACSGYYDYAAGHAPEFPGARDFTGPIVHPQHWPDDLDLTGRRVAVIGSGATAITLVPALARTAAHVTMVQRSPSWIISQPRHDATAERLQRRLPARLAHHINRLRHLALGQTFYRLTRRRPEAARQMLTGPIARRLGPDYTARHFQPSYNPWDQRLCVTPDGDLIKAVQRGDVSVATGRIDRVDADGIRLASGELVPADVIITATGLRMQLLDRIGLSVDGRPVDPEDRAVYRGLMFDGVPNFAIAVGYVNASWTLRADLASRYVCRFLRYLRRHDLAFGYPVRPADLRPSPLLPLASGYIRRASLPVQGSEPPWFYPQNYFVDALRMRFADPRRDMHFEPYDADVDQLGEYSWRPVRANQLHEPRTPDLNGESAR